MPYFQRFAEIIYFITTIDNIISYGMILSGEGIKINLTNGGRAMKVITLVKKCGKIGGTAKWVKENLESVTVSENSITCRISGTDYYLEYTSQSGCPCDVTDDEIIVREFGYYPTDAMRRVLISILNQAREIRSREDFSEKIELTIKKEPTTQAN